MRSTVQLRCTFIHSISLLDVVGCPKLEVAVASSQKASILGGVGLGVAAVSTKNVAQQS